MQNKCYVFQLEQEKLSTFYAQIHIAHVNPAKVWFDFLISAAFAYTNGLIVKSTHHLINKINNICTNIRRNLNAQNVDLKKIYHKWANCLNRICTHSSRSSTIHIAHTFICVTTIRCSCTYFIMNAHTHKCMCVSSLAGLLTWFVTFWPSHQLHKPHILCHIDTHICLINGNPYIPFKHTFLMAKSHAVEKKNAKPPPIPDDQSTHNFVICIKHAESLDLSIYLSLFFAKEYGYGLCVCEGVCGCCLCVVIVGLMTVWSNTRGSTHMCLIVDFPNKIPRSRIISLRDCLE